MRLCCRAQGDAPILTEGKSKSGQLSETACIASLLHCSRSLQSRSDYLGQATLVLILVYGDWKNNPRTRRSESGPWTELEMLKVKRSSNNALARGTRKVHVCITVSAGKFRCISLRRHPEPHHQSSVQLHLIVQDHHLEQSTKLCLCMSFSIPRAVT